MMIRKVRKRTGEIIPFQAEKITAAIEKAMDAVDSRDKKVAENLTIEIVESLYTKISTFHDVIYLHGSSNARVLQFIGMEVNLNKYFILAQANR